MKLGEKIEALLRENRMTKVELAKRMKLGGSSIITHWVKGRNPPSWENLDRLAAVFGKPAEYFKDDPGEYGRPRGAKDWHMEHAELRSSATKEDLGDLRDELVEMLGEIRVAIRGQNIEELRRGLNEIKSHVSKLAKQLKG